MFAQLSMSVSLLPFAAFGLFAAIAWIVGDVWAGKKSRLDQRLNDFDPRTAGERHAEGGFSKVSAKMSEWVGKASPQLASPLQPKTQADAGKLHQRLAHAGFRNPSAVTVYLSLKALCFLLGLSLAGGIAVLTVGAGPVALLRTITVALLAFFFPDVIVWMFASRRKLAIFLGLPDAIDLMVIAVEAGLGLDQAMRKVGEELGKSHLVLAREFQVANLQLQMGSSRIQVLRDLAERNGEDDLRALTSVLIQASRFGSGVGQALRIQSDTMRVRRRQIAEEKAAKCAVKLIFPLVLFIFPGIFVVLAGPAAISIMRQLLTVAN
jgi:tight adherence protein C